MLNFGNLLSKDNLITIGITAAVVAGGLYFAKKSGYVSFATGIGHSPDFIIKKLTRFIFSHSTNPSALIDKLPQIEQMVRTHMATIVQVINERDEGVISNLEYRQKLILIARQVAQEMNIVLRQPLPTTQNPPPHLPNGPTTGNTLAKITEWFNRRQDKINSQTKNVQEKLLRLNDIKARRLAATS